MARWPEAEALRHRENSRGWFRRRTLGHTTGTVVVLVVGLCACGWPQFRSGPDHTGYQAFETAISRANVATLHQAWSVPTGGGVQSSPAVANGVLYVGSNDRKLYALDAA